MFNPVRRNRNIGTAKQGHGQNNRLVIPDTWHDSYMFYERLRNPVKVKKKICSQEIVFLIEEPLPEFRHTCTIDDICHVLHSVPENERIMIDLIILRQPTRKQKILSSVWGRLCYFYETKDYCGVSIVLEAQPVDAVFKWHKSLTPEGQRELNRLSGDGHRVTHGSKHIEIKTSLTSCRNTQLYRTLLHELGHYQHYKFINDDSLYWTIPKYEREMQANKYADQLASKLRDSKIIPFDAIHNEKRMHSEGLKPEWFKA